MRKIAVIGSPGSGKSTLSRKLAALLGIEAVHLDALYWQPGWVETPPERWDEIVREIVNRDSWIIDGHYGRTLDMRLVAADTVILLNMSRFRCMWRAIKRRGKPRPDMNPECIERFDREAIEFLWYIWTFPQRKLPEARAKLDQLQGEKAVYVLNSPAEVVRFLQKIERQEAAPNV